MSIQEIENLIDLSVEVGKPLEIFVENVEENEVGLQINSLNGRDSLDNNPFDKVLKQVDLMSDPFECVFQEAEKYSDVPQVEVKEGHLLSLPDDDEVFHENGQEDQTNNTLAVPEFSRLGSSNSNQLSSIGSNNSNQMSSMCSFSSLYTPPALHDIFMLESPLLDSLDSNQPSTLNTAFITDNTILSESNYDNSSVLNRAFTNWSLSSQQLSKQSDCDKAENGLESVQNKTDPENDCSNVTPEKETSLKKDTPSLLKLSLINSTISPLRSAENSSNCEQSVLNEADHLADKFSKLVSVYSPKDSSCDDLMAIKPNWLDSETDIDSDLEMLRIPILEEMDQAKSATVFADVASLETKENEEENKGASSDDSKGTRCRRSLDLNALKERIELQKQRKVEDIGDVNALIEGLKKIVFECSNDDKKEEASNLLESLSSLLANQNKEKDEFLHPPTPPQSIIRQGTFDLDKPSPIGRDNVRESEIREANKTSPPLAASPQNSGNISPNIQTTVPEIVQQISKIFGNDNINVVQTNLGANSASTNPTYIVVMGTPAPLTRQSSQIFHSEGDGSPEFSNAEIRKRSQSLSLHDKGIRSQRERTRTNPVKDSKTPRYNRQSLGNTPAKPNSEYLRRSVCDPKARNITDSPRGKNSQNSPKRSMLETHHEVDTPPVIKITKPDVIPKKLKFKSSELPAKGRGPLKAVIPAKKMAPMMITSSVSSPIEDDRKKKPLTSTPVVVTSGKLVPNACSTPTVEQTALISPGQNASKNRVRYSYVSATPKPKSNAPAVSLVRRRSLTDMKPPKRGLDAVKEITIAKTQVKTIKIPHEFIKAVNKMGPNKVPRPLRRDSLLEKNKENKLPRAAK